ncbi:NTP transferase domain-containing protein [Candidatus Micrarchaeota archaeon]|nr:NTP transferase domain-containing protein [Candidatus Micrarchaeota archaeon]
MLESPIEAKMNTQKKPMQSGAGKTKTAPKTKEANGNTSAIANKTGPKPNAIAGLPTYVILAAGRGRRLWPVGEAMPKCMIRVLGKPILEWTLDSLHQNASKIVIVVGYKKEMITGHFKDKPYAGKIRFVEQREQKGTGHALLQAESEVKGPFVTVNGDSFAEGAMFELIHHHIQNNKDAHFAIAQKVGDARPFGLFEIQNRTLKSIREKPAEKTAGLVGLGNYYLPQSFFALLQKIKPSPRGEYEITDALNAFAASEKLAVHEFTGYRSEMTYFWDHLDINIHVLVTWMEDARSGTIENGAVVEGKLHLGKGSIIKAGSRIEGPVYIGENCLIGPNAFIRSGSVIENNCHVGTSEIKNSVVMNGANVPHFSYIGDSVLCDNVNLGAGTMIANLRFDNGPIVVHFKDQGKVDSGRRKLGAAIGSGTKVGVNCSINCGVLIGHECKIFPGSKVTHNLDNDTEFKGD